MGVVLCLWLTAVSPPAEVVAAPVSAVTVFSDRAKVVRQTSVPLSKGVHRLTFAALPPGADGSSVSLEANGATVQRVEVHRGSLGELAQSEVDKALKELDDARTAIRALAEQRCNRDGERELLLRLRPSAPTLDAKGQPRPLETAGWKDAVAFFDARLKASDAALAELDGKELEAQKRLKAANEKVGLLANGSGEREPLQVDAVLDAAGGATTLSLSYLVPGARWTPAYDVRYRPGDAKVEVGFAAFVSQQTGEDWPASLLTLSTAVPSTLRDVPRLTVWKIGERDRFIPLSVAKPRPSNQPAEPSGATASNDELLRARLRDALAPPPDVAQLEARIAELKENLYRSKAKMELLQETVLAGSLEQIRADKQAVAQLSLEARRQRDLVKLGALTQKEAELSGLERIASESEEKQKVAKDQGDTAAADNERTKVAIAGKKARELRFEAEAATGELLVAKEMPQAYSRADITSAPGAMLDKVSEFFRGSSPDRGPPAQVAFLTPRAWQLPSYGADLPAALAGGYDFVYSAARPEALASGPEARRVPLFRKTFAAEPELTLVPGLSTSAYLMAKVVNESDRPLLRGAANLYVGADLVGQALVDTTSVGEKTRLPLGIDDAVKVERKVELVTATKGLISKDDVSTYQVRIEILSSRPQPVSARVLDQIPLSGGENVEVKLLSSDPAASLDKDLGALEWQTTLAPNVKRTVSFSYTVTRPKGERLNQWAP